MTTTNGQVMIDGEPEYGEQCSEMRHDDDRVDNMAFALEDAGIKRVIEEATDAAQQVGQRQAKDEANVGWYGDAVDSNRQNQHEVREDRSATHRELQQSHHAHVPLFLVVTVITAVVCVVLCGHESK